MLATERLATKFPVVLGTLASLLTYLAARLIAVPLLALGMRARAGADSQITPATLQLFFTYHELFLHTVPYFLAGIVARLMARAPGVLFCALAFFAVSHWYQPLPYARWVFDYVRLSTYALGVLAASGAIVFRDWLRKRHTRQSGCGA